MAQDPQFLTSVRTEMGQISVANTNRDGTGTIVSIFTAGASGSKILSIEVKATGNTTGNIIRFFLNDGVNKRLWYELTSSVTTVSGTVQSFYQRIAPDLLLESGWSLEASTHAAETFNVIATGGDY